MQFIGDLMEMIQFIGLIIVTITLLFWSVKSFWKLRREQWKIICGSY